VIGGFLFLTEQDYVKTTELMFTKRFRTFEKAAVMSCCTYTTQTQLTLHVDLCLCVLLLAALSVTTLIITQLRPFQGLSYKDKDKDRDQTHKDQDKDKY